MIIDICPRCSSPGYHVEKLVVDYFTKKDNTSSSEFYACCDSTCEVAYFAKNTLIKCDELKSTLWYKDKSLNVQVCYCSNITRLEVYESVYSYNAKTISDVQRILGKNRTGFCKEENPVGGCCKNVFLYTIEEALKMKKESTIKFPHCKTEES